MDLLQVRKHNFGMEMNRQSQVQENQNSSRLFMRKKLVKNGNDKNGILLLGKDNASTVLD